MKCNIEKILTEEEKIILFHLLDILGKKHLNNEKIGLIQKNEIVYSCEYSKSFGFENYCFNLNNCPYEITKTYN